jgi:hypothetical protein
LGYRKIGVHWSLNWLRTTLSLLSYHRLNGRPAVQARFAVFLTGGSDAHSAGVSQQIFAERSLYLQSLSEFRAVIRRSNASKPHDRWKKRPNERTNRTILHARSNHDRFALDHRDARVSQTDWEKVKRCAQGPNDW